MYYVTSIQNTSSVTMVTIIFLVQSTSSYVLFYRRCTEGKRAAGSLDRSLSVSFDEELRESKCKFRQKQNSQSMEVDTNRIEEDKEEEGEGEGAVGTEGVDDTQVIKYLLFLL